MTYYTKAEINSVLSHSYSEPYKESIDKLIYWDNNKKVDLNLYFLKFVICNYNWDSIQITNQLLFLSNKLKITNVFIRFDLDCIYKHQKKNSYYLFQGHGAHLCTSLEDLTCSFVYIENVNFTSINQFVTNSFDSIPKLINQPVPNSSHLIINNIVSYNISFIC